MSNLHLLHHLLALEQLVLLLLQSRFPLLDLVFALLNNADVLIVVLSDQSMVLTLKLGALRVDVEMERVEVGLGGLINDTRLSEMVKG